MSSLEITEPRGADAKAIPRNAPSTRRQCLVNIVSVTTMDYFLFVLGIFNVSKALYK